MANDRFLVDFSVVKTTADLAMALGCSEALVVETIALNAAGGPPSIPIDGEILELAIPVPGTQPAYVSTLIPKKNRHRLGEYRRIWMIQNLELANAQKSLLRRLSNYLEAHLPDFPLPCIHGFVQGRSTLSNARAHLGARLLLRADIHDFFPSISVTRIERALMNAGLSESGATLLAQFTTISGSLPLGFNASPLLANLVCRPVDALMMRAAEEHACVYTRYADDLTLSGETRLPSRETIKNILASEGFDLAEHKFLISKRGQRHFVTGLSVADERAPRVPKRFKRRIRQELHYANRYGIEGHAARRHGTLASALNRIDGRIAYVRGIEPDVGGKFVREWKMLLARDKLRVLYPTRFGRAPSRLAMLFDESSFVTSAGDVFSLCCVVLDDPDGTRQQVRSFVEHYRADPFSSGRKYKFERNGLHYADDSEEIRTDFIKLLAQLPLRAFVAYGVRPDSLTYGQAYFRLFRTLLLHRFFAADGRDVEVFYEQNPQIPHGKLEAIFNELYEALASRGLRCPVAHPRLRRETKQGESLLALPDYFLGVFRAFAQSQANPNTRELSTKRFERLRDRFRLIVSVDSGERYSRHHPFDPWPVGSPARSNRN